MAFTWYGNQSTEDSCNFGSLALVWPLLQEMNLAHIIDQHLPADPQAEYSHGTVLTLLLAARLYSPLALSNVGEWAKQSGADILWDMPVEKMNDDRLGRSLDAFFTQRHSILARVALHVAKAFQVSLKEIHYDPTHLVFYGAYAGSQARDVSTTPTTPANSAAANPAATGDPPPDPDDPADTRSPMPSDDALPPAHITHGRPVGDAPRKAKMVHVGLCTVVDELGGLPLFGHTVGGNENGHTAVAQQLDLLKDHLRLQKLTMISDRGTFSAGHLLRLADEGFHALCSAPWGDFRELFDEQRQRLHWKKASFLSIEQQRRRQTNSSLPQEHYELAVVRHELTERDSNRTIACRVIFVFSTAEQKVVRQNREKTIRQIQAGLEKLAQSVAEGRRNTTPTWIARRVSKLFGKKQAARYFSYEMLPLSPAERAALPAAGRGCRLAEHRLEFCYDAQAAVQDEPYDGRSVLVTTVPSRQGSADVLFTKFKQQNHSEQAHHQWKTPLAVHPVFLKSPKRVEALVFLMTLALTAYYLLQRLYRGSLEESAPVSQRRTTSETLFRLFGTYSVLVEGRPGGRVVRPTRLTAAQRAVLHQLGFPTPAQTLSRRLPRAPP